MHSLVFPDPYPTDSSPHPFHTTYSNHHMIDGQEGYYRAGQARHHANSVCIEDSAVARGDSAQSDPE